VAEQDVGCLVGRVGEQQPAHGAPAGRLGLSLDRRVALKLGDADQAEESQHQLVEGGHGTVGEDGRGVRVEPGGQVVRHQSTDVIGEPHDAVAVGNDLVVNYEHEDLDPEALEPDPVGEASEVVPEVQRTGGAIPAEHPEALRARCDPAVESGAAPHGGAEGIGGDRQGRGSSRLGAASGALTPDLTTLSSRPKAVRDRVRSRLPYGQPPPRS